MEQFFFQLKICVFSCVCLLWTELASKAQEEKESVDLQSHASTSLRTPDGPAADQPQNSDCSPPGESHDKSPDQMLNGMNLTTNITTSWHLTLKLTFSCGNLYRGGPRGGERGRWSAWKRLTALCQTYHCIWLWQTTLATGRCRAEFTLSV